MFVTPFKVSLPITAVHLAELPIVQVLIAQVSPVSSIFLVVEYMIVVAGPVVVPLVPVVARRRDWNKERSPKQESAERQKALHFVKPLGSHVQVGCQSPVAHVRRKFSLGLENLTTKSGHMTAYG